MRTGRRSNLSSFFTKRTVLVFGEYRGERHSEHVVRGRNRDAENGRHARTHAWVDVLDGDARGESLMPFLIRACGAMRSTIRAFYAGTDSAWISTSRPFGGE
jgi:hypothetical protein